MTIQKNAYPNNWNKAKQIFLDNHGLLRNSQAKDLGIDPQTLTRMTESGLLIKLNRGLYQLADLPPLDNEDLIIVASKSPKAVFCLISALYFHDLTTQIPYRVQIALPQGSKPPKLSSPPLDVTWRSSNLYSPGIDEYIFSGIKIKVYNLEKTIADCFKFRNKLGKQIALEALKEYLQRKERNIPKLLEYAHLNRIENIITPYLEFSQ